MRSRLWCIDARATLLRQQRLDYLIEVRHADNRSGPLAWITDYRISREERILRQDPVYRKFAERVRYRLIPGLY
jgi:hypothetical protein